MGTSLHIRHEARERVLADYALLRKLMVAMLQATRAALRDDRQRPVLRAAVVKLRAEVDRHLELEERELAPALRAADERAQRWADRMASDHAEQRRALAALAESASDTERRVSDLADEVADFVRSFEVRLREEHEALEAHVASQRS